MAHYIRLSYDLSEKTPCPDGLWPVQIEHNHDMGKGKISNVFTLTLCNHVGTHIDGPNHFGRTKKKLNEFDLDRFIFDRPFVLDIPKEDNGLVAAEDLVPFKDQINQCDILLMRTGFAKVRKDNLKRYAENNPGFTESAARFIVDQCPDLCVLAMDSLSFAGMQNLNEGIKAHQVLLDECQRDIFLIEDIHLDFDFSNLEQIIVAPLFCEKVDSAPCTILAKIA